MDSQRKAFKKSIISEIRNFFNSKRSKKHEPYISIEQHEAAVKKNPQDKEAWMTLANLYNIKFDFEKSIRCKTKASEIFPDDAGVKFSLGCSYCAKGDIPMAIKSYLEALVLRPDYLEATECIAEQYLIIGDQEKADEWLSKAKRIRLQSTNVL